MKILAIIILSLIFVTNIHSKPVVYSKPAVCSKQIVYSNPKNPLTVKEKIAYRQTIIKRIIKIQDERDALIKVLLQLNLELGNEGVKGKK